MKRCNLSVFQKSGDQPRLCSVITPILNCYSILWRRGKKKAKKPSASLESINWYLLADLSQFQPYSLCLVQPQARNQSTYFPLDLWGLQAVFEAPPSSLRGGYRSSASTPPAAARECGSRGWTKGQVLHWQYLPSGFVIVALMWDFFTELPGVQHWFGFYEDPQPLSLLSKTIPSSCAWPRMKAARRSTLSY